MKILVIRIINGCVKLFYGYTKSFISEMHFISCIDDIDMRTALTNATKDLCKSDPLICECGTFVDTESGNEISYSSDNNNLVLSEIKINQKKYHPCMVQKIYETFSHNGFSVQI